MDRAEVSSNRTRVGRGPSRTLCSEEEQAFDEEINKSKLEWPPWRSFVVPTYRRLYGIPARKKRSPNNRFKPFLARVSFFPHLSPLSLLRILALGLPRELSYLFLNATNLLNASCWTYLLLSAKTFVSAWKHGKLSKGWKAIRTKDQGWLIAKSSTKRRNERDFRTHEFSKKSLDVDYLPQDSCSAENHDNLVFKISFNSLPFPYQTLQTNIYIHTVVLNIPRPSG